MSASSSPGDAVDGPNEGNGDGQRHRAIRSPQTTASKGLSSRRPARRAAHAAVAPGPRPLGWRELGTGRLAETCRSIAARGCQQGTSRGASMVQQCRQGAAIVEQAIIMRGNHVRVFQVQELPRRALVACWLRRQGLFRRVTHARDFVHLYRDRSNEQLRKKGHVLARRRGTVGPIRRSLATTAHPSSRVHGAGAILEPFTFLAVAPPGGHVPAHPRRSD